MMMIEHSLDGSTELHKCKGKKKIGKCLFKLICKWKNKFTKKQPLFDATGQQKRKKRQLLKEEEKLKTK
jgi:uncharacterized membrane protein YqjE